MLSPEVWKFSPPPCNIVCKYGLFEGKKDICEDVIKKHHFNHLVSVLCCFIFVFVALTCVKNGDVGLVSVVLPNTVIVPSPIVEALNEDSAYYKAVGVDISKLVAKEFLDAFVKQGQLSVLSDKTRIDVDDCVCITPCGHLVLSLQRKTYLELGLEGKPSFFSHKKSSRYTVKIDLKASHFIPGKKNYDRVLWCLQENLKLKFDLLIAWESPDDKICPSSVAAYLHSQGYVVSVCQPRFTQHLDYNVLVPELENNGENDCSPMDLLEWLGSFSLNVDVKSGSPSNYLTTYQTPVGAKMCEQIASLQWTGYFTTRKLMKLFESLRKYATLKEDFPWISLYVQGFADSPVSWGLKEHNFFLDGDNEYTIFVRAKNFMACSVLSSNKVPK